MGAICVTVCVGWGVRVCVWVGGGHILECGNVQRFNRICTVTVKINYYAAYKYCNTDEKSSR